MRYLFLALLIVACDKSKPDTSEKAEKDSVSVKDYCAKMIKLDIKTAKANGAEGPDPDQLMPFCKMLFERAKSKEPEAYACMADCMMDADSRSDEQACIAKKKCLAKANDPKLFSNRKD
jgi:hypothetical protein